MLQLGLGLKVKVRVTVRIKVKVTVTVRARTQPRGCTSTARHTPLDPETYSIADLAADCAPGNVKVRDRGVVRGINVVSRGKFRVRIRVRSRVMAWGSIAMTGLLVDGWSTGVRA